MNFQVQTNLPDDRNVVADSVWANAHGKWNHDDTMSTPCAGFIGNQERTNEAVLDGLSSVMVRSAECVHWFMAKESWR